MQQQTVAVIVTDWLISVVVACGAGRCPYSQISLLKPPTPATPLHLLFHTTHTCVLQVANMIVTDLMNGNP